MIYTLAKFRNSAFNLCAVMFVIFAFVGCQASKKTSKLSSLLSTPSELLEHNVALNSTFYTFTKYKENTSILEVVRDREGKILAGLLLDDSGAFVVLPNTLPIPVKSEYVDMIRDELRDVWIGDQIRFSFVPVFND